MVTILLNETFVKIQETTEGYFFLHTAMHEYVGNEENPFEGTWKEVHAPVFLSKKGTCFEKAIFSLLLQCSLLNKQEAEEILHALWIYSNEEY